MKVRRIGAGFAIIVVLTAMMLHSAQAAEKADWPKAVALGAASIGGTAYVVCAAYAKIISDKMGIPASCEATGGSVHNPQLLHAAKVAFGHVAQGAAWEGYTGGGWAKGKKFDNIRAAWPVYPQVYHGWSLAKSGIKTFRDIEGKIVSGGPAGGTSDSYLRDFCKVLGIKPKRFVNAAFGDTDGQLRDGLLDAVFTSSGVPHPSANEVTSTLDGVIIGFEQKDLDKIFEAFPYLTPGTINANTYKKQTQAIPTNADWVAEFTHKDVPDDFVYEVVKQVFANKSLLVATHKALEDVQEGNVKNIILPLHKGAYRFYKERTIPVPQKAMPIE